MHIVSPEWLNQQTRVTAPLANNAYASRKGGVRFERLVLDTSDHDLDAWSADTTALCDVKAASHGTIEDAGPDVLHLDFANAYMGGGVLGQGCVQEEIRFLICPELIVSRLLCERLQDNEATLFQGFERFSNYTGYAKSFAYAGPYEDAKEADRRPPLLAIDATHFRYGSNLQQFGDPSIERELNKALAGFTPSPSEGSLNLPLCTGNWGCGAFGGDLQMKALIQLLAASLANRPCMHYLTFGDDALADGLNRLVARLKQNSCSVGELVKLLRKFPPTRWPQKPPLQGVSGYYADLFGFIERKLDRHEQRQAETAAEAVKQEGEVTPPTAARPAAEAAAAAYASQEDEGAKTEEDPCE